MFTLKQCKLEYCDYIVTEAPFGTANGTLIEKHVESGGLIVKVANEQDMPVFADGSKYLEYLIQMQKLGATRKQCILVILGKYSEYSAEISINWQLLGGTCILLDDEKRMPKVLIDLAAFQQNSTDDLLISVPYVSYDVVVKERGQSDVFPFLLQLLAAIDNEEALVALGIPSNKANKMRERIGIPEAMTVFVYKEPRDEPEE